MTKKKSEVTLIPVAILDDNNIYQGVAMINSTDLKESHVQVPEDCDLAKGKYQWDPVIKTFVPLCFINRDLKVRG